MSRFFFKENRIDRISGFPMIYIGKKILWEEIKLEEREK